MNLANKITISRIVLIPILIIMLIYEQKGTALIIFLISAISDAADGFIARSMGQKTKLGTMLDPLADKLLLTSAFIAVAILHIIPVWLVIIVVSRDVILIIGALIIHILGGDLKITPSILGKCTTFFQLCTVFTSMTFSYYPKFEDYYFILTLLIWITPTFTILSGLQYIFRGSKILNGNHY